MSHSFDDKFIIPSLGSQLGLDLGCDASDIDTGVYFSAPDIDLSKYEKLIIAFSGGKDSIACILHLIDLGVDMRKAELWHHDVDGREGSTLMDWAFMSDFNRKFADAFNLPIYFSWLKHGFEGELLKENSYSHPHMVETPEGLLTLERDTTRAKPGTRLKFPQVGANLQTRWCSSALKIDVGRRALNNQPRFNRQNVLFITGERRQESSNRAKYNQFEPHACDRRKGTKARHVDSWRPILDWPEERVWDALKRHNVLSPVPYRIGWSRSSCRLCIFNDDELWATLRHYFPGSLDAVAGYEKKFDNTISRSRINVLDLSHQAEALQIDDLEALGQARRTEYTLPILSNDSPWKLPAGAFSRSNSGPS